MSKIIIPSKNIYQAGDVGLLPDNIVDNVNVTYSWQTEGNETEIFNAEVYSFDNVEPETENENEDPKDNYPIGYSTDLSKAEHVYKSDFSSANYEIITKDGSVYSGRDVPFSSIAVGEDDDTAEYGYTMTPAKETEAGSKIWTYTSYLSGFQGQLYKFHFDEDIPIDRISLLVNPRFQSTRNAENRLGSLFAGQFYPTSGPISNRTYPLNDDTDVIAIDKSATYTTGETVRENSGGTFAISYDYNLIKANSISDIVAAVYNSDGTIKTECLSPRKFSFRVHENPDYNYDETPEFRPYLVLGNVKYPTTFFENLCFTTKAFYIKNADNSTDIFCVIPYAIKYATRACTFEGYNGTYQAGGTISAAITNVSFVVHRDVASSTTLYTNTNNGKTETTGLPNESLGSANYSIDIGEFGTGAIAVRTSSEIYNKYKNGNRQLTLKCSISDYYYENGEVAIDTNSLTKETSAKYIYKYIYQEFIGESWRDDYWSSGVSGIKIDNPDKYYMLNSPDGLGQTMYYMNSANDSVVATVKTIPSDLDTSTYQILSYRVKIITYNVYAYDKDVYISRATNGAYLRYRSTDIYTKDLSTIGNGDCIYIIPNELGNGYSSRNYFYQVEDFDSFDDVVEKIKNGDLTIAEITEIIGCRGIIASRGRYCKIAVVLPIWTYGHYKPSGTNYGEVRYYDVGEVEIYSYIKTYDKNMTFVGGETVIPYRATKSDSYGNTIEEPYLTDKNGNPIAFDVVKVKVYSDGAVWQELTLQEHVEKT